DGALFLVITVQTSGVKSSSFHNRSTGSPQALANPGPLGGNATANGRLLCPPSLYSSFGLAPVTSQMMACVSAQPVASHLLSALNAMPLGLPSSFAHDVGSFAPSL